MGEEQEEERREGKRKRAGRGEKEYGGEKGRGGEGETKKAKRRTDTPNPQRTQEKGRDKITEMDRGKETLNDTTKGNELFSKYTQQPSTI